MYSTAGDMQSPAYLSFRRCNPVACRQSERVLLLERASDGDCVAIIERSILRMLGRAHVPVVVASRLKGLDSIYTKARSSGCSPLDVMDRIGLRVIVTSVPDCYRVLGFLHDLFTPILGTFDDYIAVPKPNGYQSLHTCVYPLKNVSYKPVEFQVRTAAMHRHAVIGLAAHWRYKRSFETRTVTSWRPPRPAGLSSAHVDSLSTRDFLEGLERHLLGFGGIRSWSAMADEVPGVAS